MVCFLCTVCVIFFLLGKARLSLKILRVICYWDLYAFVMLLISTHFITFLSLNSIIFIVESMSSDGLPCTVSPWNPCTVQYHVTVASEKMWGFWHVSARSLEMSGKFKHISIHRLWMFGEMERPHQKTVFVYCILRTFCPCCRSVRVYDILKLCDLRNVKSQFHNSKKGPYKNKYR